MKKHELLLLRHGKSDWPAGVADDQRPLKGRGKKNAQRMGVWLVEQDLLPDYIISSPALRALGTAQKVCDAIGFPYSRITEDARIYEAGLDELLQVLHELPENAARVLLVGHNPGLEHLLINLCSVIEVPKDGKLLPTASLAHLQINRSWSELSFDDASLVSITRPKSLPEKFPCETAAGIEYRERPCYFYTQSALIPYRKTQNGFEVLLVGTRKNNRWTIPKGIVHKHMTPLESARQEALEEAGVKGQVHEQALGCYEYVKWGASCEVTVFAMAVDELVDETQWAESHRGRQWVPIESVAEYMTDDALSSLILQLQDWTGSVK